MKRLIDNSIGYVSNGSEAVMNNTADLNSFEDSTEFVFNRRLLLNVIAYTVMSIIGTVSNTSVFIAAYRRSRFASSHLSRTNVHFMVLHLTTADLIVSFVVMPFEVFWRISVQWYIGNLSCKIFMFLRAFAFYLSSMTLVCLSLDRYVAISTPLATLELRSTRKRGKIMLAIAWVISGICAFPQVIVFRVLKHPKAEFYQCTSIKFFGELYSSFNITSPVVSSDHAESLYSVFFLAVVYIIPLIFIIITYYNVWRKILKNSYVNRRSPKLRYTFSNKKEKSDIFKIPVSSTKDLISVEDKTSERLIEKPADELKTSKCCEETHHLRRHRRDSFSNSSQNAALKMSCIHIVAFVSCWTPYLIISLWHIIDSKTVKGVSSEIQDILFLTAVLNSIINPLVYGSFYLRIFNRNKRQPSDFNKPIRSFSKVPSFGLS